MSRMSGSEKHHLGGRLWERSKLFYLAILLTLYSHQAPSCVVRRAGQKPRRRRRRRSPILALEKILVNPPPLLLLVCLSPKAPAVSVFAEKGERRNKL